MRIPTILGLVLLLIALSLGIFIHIYNDTQLKKAKAITAPQKITVTNITENSASISWETNNPATGQVAWGETDSLGELARDDRDLSSPSPHNIHFITLKKLKDNTRYFYKVRSGLYFFPETSLQFKTAKKLAQNQNSQTLQNPIIGKVLSKDFQPIDETLIYLEFPGSQALATFTSIAGNFLLPLSNIRTKSLADPLSIPPKSQATLKVIKSDAASEAKILLPMQNQILPPIVLGQNIDLTEIKASPSAQLKKYDLNGDGVVNSLDLSILFQNLGSTPKLKAADLNGDGVVDQKDVDLLKSAVSD